ncbi:MAG: hypothetical protein PHZ17_03400 [Sulfurovum sp.]|nr:hypothetical protein [Sulfurovum sp.]
MEMGFKMNIMVQNIRSIKGVASGDFNGKAFKASVQIKCINIDEIDDPLMGIVEKETILLIKVPCDDMDIKPFNNYLRDLQKSNKPFIVDGNIPREAGKDTYQVTSLLTARQIMSQK